MLSCCIALYRLWLVQVSPLWLSFSISLTSVSQDQIFVVCGVIHSIKFLLIRGFRYSGL